MPRRLLATAALFIAVAATFSLRRIGDLGVRDSRIAAAHATRDFDRAVWHAHDPVARGQMLASLAVRHRLVGQHRDSVEALLGPGNDCYVGYEDEPCYTLRFDSRSFELQFPVNHASAVGRVLAMRLVPRP